MGTNYLFYKGTFVITGSQDISYWSWILASPIVYTMWKFIENYGERGKEI